MKAETKKDFQHQLGVPFLWTSAGRLAIFCILCFACNTNVYDIGRSGTDVKLETETENVADSDSESTVPLGSALPERMPESGGSEILFVDPVSGSDDTGDGTEALPFLTINYALSLVSLSGGIVEVLGDSVSVYSESDGPYAIMWNRSGDPSDPVTLRTRTPFGVTVRGPGAGEPQALGAWVWGGGTGFRIRGFRFSVTGVESIGVQVDYGSRDIEIDLIEAAGNGGPGVVWKGGIAGTEEETARIQMWNSILHDNGVDCDPDYPEVGDGYDCTEGSHNAALGILYNAEQTDSAGVTDGLVANCVFHGSMPGRHLQIGSQAHDFFVVNNTFYGNDGTATKGFVNSDYAGTAVQIFSGDLEPDFPTSGVVVKNNIMAANRGHAVYGSTTVDMLDNIVSYNLAWADQNLAGGGTEEDYPTDYEGVVLFVIGPEGNLPNADPLFADEEAFDFHLRSAGPAEAAGDPAYTPPADLDGIARTGADLGAYATQ